tara:strand:- start:3444 stop:4286 length:843 start_codon:yes stop_codon:yes gene_type:complete
MRKYLLQYIFSCFFFLSAQSSPFASYDVVIYPEYYFSGVMAEIEAEILEPSLPLNITLQVPSDTDSVFYVSGDSDSPEVVETNIYKENGFAYIDKEITDKKFRIFIFYGLSKNGTRRSGDFNFQVNHSIDDAHIVVQEPLVANNFIFSEQNHEDFKDQHGINFKRIHLRGYIANSAKNITFTYDNPTQDISINVLQKGAQAPQNVSTPQNTGPIRHKLPLWQPLAALGVVSIVIGGMFYRQVSTESSAPNPAQPKGKFCTECGNKILPKNKFCSNCGAKV